jgi:hypothetical protein
VARRPAVDRRAAAAGVLRDVRRDPALAQFHDEFAGIEAAVRAERRRAHGRQPVEHGHCRQPLRVPRGAGQRGADTRPLRFYHQDIADRAEPRLHARAVEQRIGIVVEPCVTLLRPSPRKSGLGLRPTLGGVPSPSFP